MSIPTPQTRLRIALSGARGLIGTALRRRLTGEAHEITPIVRAGGKLRKGRMIGWNPEQGTLDAAGLEGQDAVIHLAGEGIASGRWTPRRKEEILNSRVQSTALFARTLAGLAQPPQVFICASAIGFYGDRGAETLTESSAAGEGFLAEVCKAWETATKPAVEAGIRVVNLRTGIVLDPAGGALGKMLPPFQLGLGGRLGSGEQYMSWISMADEVGAIRHALLNATLAGPLNLTAPNPVTNAEFARALGRAVKMPVWLPVPAFVLRLALGSEMAEALLLTGNKVLPERLQQAGYTFEHPTLDIALAAALERQVTTARK